MNDSAPVTAETVEQFLIARLNEIQAMVPEYATLQIEVARHIHDGQLSDPSIRWMGYLSSGSHFPKANGEAHIGLDLVMDHVAHVVKDRTPVNVAAKLREQAFALIHQAEQCEIKAGLPISVFILIP